MKYFKHIDNDRTKYYAAEGTPNVNIPPDENNMDYARMMEGVNADPPTNTIEEVDDTE
jgi:hypothetical protein